MPRLRVPPCGIFRSVPNCAIVCEVIQGIEKHVEFSARDLLYVAESQLFFSGSTSTLEVGSLRKPLLWFFLVKLFVVLPRGDSFV